MATPPAAAVFIFYDSGTLTLTNSTVYSNTASSFGGGICFGSNTNLTIMNSTFSGNTAGLGGGAIADLSAATILSITNSTLYRNHSTADDGGGGLDLASSTADIKNTILAGNTRGEYGEVNNFASWGGEINSLGYNLENGTDCGFTSTGDLQNTNPLLGPLQDNGGDTWTHALLGGSPAIDAIPEGGNNYNGAPTTDQRGILRPVGSSCDIGAVEAVLTKAVDDATPSPGQRITYTISVYNWRPFDYTNVLISDTLPGSLTFAGPVTLDPSQPGATLADETGDLPTLASGVTITAATEITLTFPVTVNLDTAGQTIVNTASLTSTQGPTPALGSVTITVPPADLRITKSVTPTSACPGDAITYTLTFSNAQSFALGVVITDSVPVTVTDTSVVSSGVTITDIGASPGYVWNVQDLAAGQGGVITITGVLSTPLPGGHVFTNTATITTTVVESTPGNNNSEAGVTVQNVAPVAVDDTPSTDEDTPVTISVLSNDTDANGDPLSVSAAGTPTYGSVAISGTTQVVYTPTNRTADYTAVFTYTASDGSLSDTATVTVTVYADNDAPNAVDDTASTDEDTPVTISVLDNDSDPDTDDTLSIGAVGTPDTYGSAAIHGTNIVYTPTNRTAGYTAVFTYTASDGSLSDTATVTVTVSADNDVPVADAGPDQSVATEVVVTPDGSGSYDPDVDTSLTYSWRQTGGPSVALSDGAIQSPTFTSLGDPAVLTFTLVVTDALGLADATPDEVVVTVVEYYVYLPLVFKSYVVAPDLVVQSITATADGVQVVIANQGDASVTDEFWVDVYINPDLVPTAVNQVWSDLADEGLVWGVTAEMQPGDVITLTVGGDYYVAEYSEVSWPLPEGTPVYAQVDSVNTETTYGAVLESHEIAGGAYNNISSTVSTAGVAGAALPLAGGEPRPDLSANLPTRP